MRIGAPETLLISGICCAAGASWFGLHLAELRRAVRPIYVELGIVPELFTGVQSASALQHRRNTEPPVQCRSRVVADVGGDDRFAFCAATLTALSSFDGLTPPLCPPSPWG